MADEQANAPYLSEAQRRDAAATIPKGRDWPALLAKDGDELEVHYRKTLEELGKQSGMLGLIFRKAQNKIQNPKNVTYAHSLMPMLFTLTGMDDTILIRNITVR